MTLADIHPVPNANWKFQWSKRMASWLAHSHLKDWTQSRLCRRPQPRLLPQLDSAKVIAADDVGPLAAVTGTGRTARCRTHPAHTHMSVCVCVLAAFQHGFIYAHTLMSIGAAVSNSVYGWSVASVSGAMTAFKLISLLMCVADELADAARCPLAAGRWPLLTGTGHSLGAMHTQCKSINKLGMLLPLLMAIKVVSVNVIVSVAWWRHKLLCWPFAIGDWCKTKVKLCSQISKSKTKPKPKRKPEIEMHFDCV